MQSNRSPELTYGFGFFALLLLTTWLYWPGLNSLFILDDDPNLQPLSQINTLANLGQFITEGDAGPLGRPVSLLTFALQYYSWPHDPFSFKYVNLMVHLLNACLIFWFALQLSRFVTSPHRGLQLALLTTGLWLLTPLQVSTVLYVVQRMTQLSTLFTLLGLVAYLQGRYYLAQKKLLWGYLLASFGIGISGILAILSKENGVLLILYIFVLEITILPALTPSPRYWRHWFATFIYLPLITLIIYFTFFVDITATYSGRDFSLWERLLTETRVLSSYVAKMLLFQPHGFGVFHDDYVISKGLFTPPLTFLTTSLLIIAFIVAVKWRRTYPLFALGILWFLAGHVLESSFLGLVIYFEHRNYLPMFSILFAVGYGGIYALAHLKTHTLRWLSLSLLSIWLILFPLLTWVETTLWANPFKQARIWATEKPFSRFAQSHAALLFDAVGDYESVLAYHQHMVQAFPEDTGPYVLWLSLACRQPTIPFPDLEKVLQRFQTGVIDSAAVSGLNDIILKRQQGQCHLDSKTLSRLFKVLVRKNTGVPPELYQLYAMFLAQERDYDEAITWIDKMLLFKKAVKGRLLRLRWLVFAKRWQEATDYVQIIRTELTPLEYRLYKDELEHWSQQINKIIEIKKEIGL